MMKISHIASALTLVASVVSVEPAFAQQNSSPGVIAEKAPSATMGSKTQNFIELNRASQAELEKIPSLGKAGADLIIMARQKGAFRDAADLARRTCGQAPLNLEETSIQIGPQPIPYRGGEPKAAGWRCGAAPGTYSINYKIYKY